MPINNLKKLRLPTFLAEYAKPAKPMPWELTARDQPQRGAAENKDHVQYLLRLCELELIERERRVIKRRIKAPKFPTTRELARCEFVDKRGNVIALGLSGTGKANVALGLGLAACQKGLKVNFTTAAALVNELIVPLCKTGAELFFDVISQRYERGSITSNLPFDEWRKLQAAREPKSEKMTSSKGARRCGYDASPKEKLGQRRALTTYPAANNSNVFLSLNKGQKNKN